jgi:DeoR/GlpR family transcriptional regulator of sugar metabolism
MKIAVDGVLCTGHGRCYSVASEPGTPPLTVYTNSLPIAATLHGNPDVIIRIIGGTIRGITSAAVGPAAVAQLAEIRPDIAFLGPNSEPRPPAVLHL